MADKEYGLKFTYKAEEDLDEIFGYIANNLLAPGAAENLMDTIQNKIMQIKAFPYSCGFVLDEPLKKRGYRRLIVDNYIMFYRVNELENLVVIMRILYGASNYNNIL